MNFKISDMWSAVFKIIAQLFKSFKYSFKVKRHFTIIFSIK